MSYLFQSRQLHPRHCGLGTVGPEQAWTSETARQIIAEATESCPSSYERKRRSEFVTIPKKEAGGEIVDDLDCVQTGKIWEAKRPGSPRTVEWCCPTTQFAPPRRLTQEEFEMWSPSCTPVQDARGLIYETIPEWRDPERVVKEPCSRTNILDEGYELVCCPAPGSNPTLTHRDVQFVQAAPTEEQQAQWEAHRQEAELAFEQARQEAALEPATIIDRYGLPLLLVGGVLGVGVTAALFRRFSVATEKAKEAKTAALKARKGE